MNKDYLNAEIELTDSEKEWFEAPRARAEFQAKLSNEIRSQFMLNKSIGSHKRIGKMKSLINQGLGTGSMRFGLARTLVPVLAALLLITGVTYAVASYLGYIPGFGMVDPAAAIKVLSSAKEQVKEGIQLRLVSVMADPNNTSVVYSLKGIPPSIYMHSLAMDPFARGCMNSIWLELPDGTRLDLMEEGSLGYNSDNVYQKTAFFGPLPNDVNKGTFHMNCLEDTQPGWGPENWAIPFSLVAGNDIATFPVLKAQSNPANAVNNSFTITNLIPVKDGFIILGSYEPPYDEIQIRSTALYDIRFLDVNGNHLLYRNSTDFPLPKSIEKESFAYFVEANVESFPLTLRASKIYYHCDGKSPFRLDLSKLPSANQSVTVNESIEMRGCPLQVATISNDGQNILLKVVSSDNYIDQIDVHLHNQPIQVPQMISNNAGIIILKIPSSSSQKFIDLDISVGLIPIDLPSVKIELDNFK
ncbi:MAG TPA: hypothetical protein VJL10_12250 [Anaerolineales bacterium]|nr:hypothetical protein [Anaerolineales bacterium]